jgi:8-oxo-dGTP pyrophosphatase MutT (NUDIX family)
LDDWFFRFVYRHGIRAARLWWRFTRPRTLGAHVMIWHDGKVVLVRTSYRADWMAPGGGLKRSETPVEGAVREVSEEVGLTLRADDLHLVQIIEHTVDHRRDRLHLFETHATAVPAIRIDNREVVEARWVGPSEAQSLNLAPPFRDYLGLKAQERGS